MPRLGELHLRILEVVAHRDPDLRSQIGMELDISKLPHEVRERITDILSDEMAEKGIGDDGELNKYGLERDDMIGACGLGLDEL